MELNSNASVRISIKKNIIKFCVNALRSNRFVFSKVIVNDAHRRLISEIILFIRFGRKLIFSLRFILFFSTIPVCEAIVAVIIIGFFFFTIARVVLFRLVIIYTTSVCTYRGLFPRRSRTSFSSTGILIIVVVVLLFPPRLATLPHAYTRAPSGGTTPRMVVKGTCVPRIYYIVPRTLRLGTHRGLYY